MARMRVNGAQIYYELSGNGQQPAVLVHGGLGSHLVWERMIPSMEESFRVLNYDRRGHGDSDLPGEQMTVQDHVDDLAAMIEEMDIAPAWVVANSSGGAIALRLAGERPELLRGVIAHEPPLFGLLTDDPETAPMAGQALAALGKIAEKASSGDNSGAAQEFSEAMIGPGIWDSMPDEIQQDMINNAANFPKDDPQTATCDPERVGSFMGPVLLTTGERSPPMYGPVIEKLTDILPAPNVAEIAGTGHVPQITHPQTLAERVERFVASHAS